MTNFLNPFTAMARVNMAHAAFSSRPSAHSSAENVTTPYNSVRLLKGTPPGHVSIIKYYGNLRKKCGVLD